MSICGGDYGLTDCCDWESILFGGIPQNSSLWGAAAQVELTSLKGWFATMCVLAVKVLAVKD